MLDEASIHIRQLRFKAEDEDLTIAATESIAYSEAVFDPGQGFSNSRLRESQADSNPDWQNEGMDSDSSLFNEEALGEPRWWKVDSYDDDFGESEEPAFSSLTLPGSGFHGSQWSGDSAEGEPPSPFVEAAEIDSLEGRVGR
jgi:twitching motility protein PilJ